jgi:hypothetical protein
MKMIRVLTCTILCVFLIWLLAEPGKTQVTYVVSVDTSPVNGLSGSLDFQFNSAGSDALPASLSITHFLTDGILAPTSVDTGSVTGSLPGPTVIFRNDDGFNDLFQNITFGNAVSFYATFDGPALSPTTPFSTSGTGFALSLYDNPITQNLLTTNPDGSLLDIAINPDGSTLATSYPDGGGIVRASATLLSTATPEPSSYSFFALGFFLFAILCLWRSYRAKKLRSF